MKKTFKLLPVVLSVFALAFMSCENEEVDVNSVELEQNLNLEQSKQEDQKNYNSITYKDNTYSIAEVYDNQELLDMYMNAEITHVRDNTLNESQKPGIFIYDSQDEFINDNPEFKNDKESNQSKVNRNGPLVTVFFYEHTNFRGARLSDVYSLRPNQAVPRNVPSNWHDRASSVQFNPSLFGSYNLSMRAVSNQHGVRFVLRSFYQSRRTVSNLSRHNFNDKLSSYQVWRRN